MHQLALNYQRVPMLRKMEWSHLQLKQSNLYSTTEYITLKGGNLKGLQG
jgi:hypothetical protein